MIDNATHGQDITQLKMELVALSYCIREAKGRLKENTDPSQYKVLKAQVRQFQWQALFYIEIIENLEREVRD